MSTLVHCQHLSHRYGSKQVLNDISFNIEAGAPVALVGPNGAGKTTLFSLMSGFILPSEGRIEILGQPPGSMAVKNQMQVLPQDAQLDPAFNVGEQLKLYCRLQGMSPKQQQSETERVLELVSMQDSIKAKPTALSHGMRKRVAIAQALIGAPKLVLLDEATAGLDPLHARQIRELIQQLSTDITFLLSSHDLHELERLCDQVLLLEHGQLREHRIQTQTNNVRQLTLVLAKKDPQIEQKISQLTGVTEVRSLSATEILISFDTDIAADLPVTLMAVCFEQQWPFKQLTSGASLETVLFTQ
ncbi:ABC transporter ATP-binding protein [Neptunicella marina]|uniref:ABC transporter ATP-binding protein n=1 Tax=Neptunicella marina TaxID=2125989 RepID=A0A8J6LVR2_9ALTE|nr:ABC transporter ATP-binding protein [Neptunicella marina]MBC3764784.1 ABC transporter ATP-binding protein [Neptunicella marina]